jgi:beta-galactosidase
MIAIDKTKLLDHNPYQATQRKLYRGLAVAILRATAPTGAITTTITIEAMPPATIALKTAPTKPSTTQRGL